MRNFFALTSDKVMAFKMWRNGEHAIIVYRDLPQAPVTKELGFKEWIERYPNIQWVRYTLRNSLYAPHRIEILAAYVVGSEAKGTARPDSDLDIAVVIPPVRGKTSMQYSDAYHMKFPSDESKPKWNGRRVDFQFFYPDDPELTGYAKIPLSESVRWWEKTTPEEDSLAFSVGVQKSDDSYEDKNSWFFNLYHLGEFGDQKNIWIWHWDGYELHVAQGGTHGSQFSHEVVGDNYKGRYSPSIGVATLLLPKARMRGRVVGEEELMKNEPEAIPVLDALHRRFPKLKKIYGL